MADPITRRVEFPSNGTTTPGYLALPAEAGPQPAVVVIQEYWGLVPHIEDVTRRFARAGFAALAPDLYHGQAAEEPDEARKLAMALDRARAVAEIAAAARYLNGLDQVAQGPVGVVGWCMGGGLAASAAAESSDFATAVVFYGRPLAAGDVARIRAPILGLYAEHDHGISVEDVRAFESQLEQHQIPHEIHLYPGVQHAFFNDTRPGIYDMEASRDAWDRTLRWFRTYLG